MTIESWKNFGKIISEVNHDTSGDKDAEISKLPIEILVYIFNNCDPQSITNIVLTCKRWYLSAFECRLTLLAQTMILCTEGASLQERIDRSLQIGRTGPRITRTLLQYNKDLEGSPAYLTTNGVYIELAEQGGNNQYYFSHLSGMIEKPFTANAGEGGETTDANFKRFLSDNAIFSISDHNTIQVLQPQTAEVSHELKLNYQTTSSIKSIYPLANGTRLLSINETGKVFLWDVHRQELLFEQQFNEDQFTFQTLKSNGSELVLHNIDETSLSFSFWHIETTQLTQFDKWEFEFKDTIIDSFHYFYLEQSHLIAFSDTDLFYFNFLNEKEDNNKVFSFAQGYITHICSAGEQKVIFSINEDNFDKIGEWNVLSNSVSLLGIFEKNCNVEHLHVVGRQIFIANSNGICVIDRNTRAQLWKTNDSFFQNWTINDMHVIGEAGRLAFIAEDKNNTNPPQHLLAYIDFTKKPLDEQKESSTS